jgi:methylglyoxal synthase
MADRKRIGLVAHDAFKPTMVDWAKTHADVLAHHDLFATGTTGKHIMDACPTLVIDSKKSGPLGGDQQIGTMIAEGNLDALFFFIDPMAAQPHDVDVKALTRLAVLYNIALALDRTTADMIITSPLFEGHYQRQQPDYTNYLSRHLG